MDFKEIINYKRDLLQMRGLLSSYNSLSDGLRTQLVSNESIEKLTNEINVLDGYVKYAEFANRLDGLYERRRNANNEEVKKNLDAEIEELTSKNEKYFGIAYFNELSKYNPQRYNELKEKYPIHLVRPETFYKSLGEEIVEAQEDIELPKLNEEVQEVKEETELVPIGELVDKPEYMTSEQVFEQQMGIPFDSNKYYIGEEGSYDDGYDNPISQLQFYERVPKEVEEKIVDNKEEFDLVPVGDLVDKPEYMTNEQVFEQQMGIPFDSNKYYIGEEGSYDDGYDNPISRLQFYEKVPRKNENVEQQTPVENPEQVEETVEENKVEETTKEVVPQWDSRLTEEQILDAYSRGIYEPVGPEYEQFLGELGLEPIKNEQANKVAEEVEAKREPIPQWDPRLTGEQILDAYSRDIFEPVGPEYEQFLGELGLEPIKNETPALKEVQQNTIENPTYDEVFNNTQNNKQEFELKQVHEPVQKPEYMTNEQVFEQVMGKPFDPDKYYIGEEGSYDDGYDNPIPELQFYEKVPKKEGPKEDTEEKKVPPTPVKKDEVEEKVEPKKELPAIIYEPDFSKYIKPEPKPTKTEKVPEPKPVPKPEPKPQPKPEPKPEPPKQTGEVITIDSILAEIIQDDIDLRIGSVNNIKNSDLSVVQNFKNRFKKNDNYVYNLFYIPASITSAIGISFKSTIGAAYKLFNPRKVADYEEVRRRLYELSDEKLEYLLEYYKSGRARENSGIAAINPLIFERLALYVEEKYVIPYREEITKLYEELSKAYANIQKLQYASIDATPEEKENFDIMAEEAVKGCAEKVDRLLTLKDELDGRINSDNGQIMLGQNAAFVNNYANRKGRIFSKKFSTKEASDYQKIFKIESEDVKTAIRDGNDMKALFAFFGEIKTKRDNTIVENSIVGKRSVGIYNWKPLPEQVELGPDPLLGYIIRTVGVLGLAKGIATEIHNQLEAMKVEPHNAQIEAHNNEVLNVNTQVQSVQKHVNQSGDELTDIGRQNVEGLEKVGYGDIVGKQGIKEYYGYQIEPDTYNVTDPANHMESTTMFNDLSTNASTIRTQLANGTMSVPDAIKAIGNQLNAIDAIKQQMYKEWDDLIHNTARGQQLASSYDYTAVNNSLPKLIGDQSLPNMVNGMVRSAEIGADLSALTIPAVTSIVNKLPINIQSFAIPLITQYIALRYIEDQSTKVQKIYKDMEDQANYEQRVDDALDYAFASENEVKKHMAEIEEARAKGR